MKTVTILDEQQRQVNVSKTISKYVTKKKNKKQILQKYAAQNLDPERKTTIATLTCRLIFPISTLKNTIGLQQSEQLKNKE